MLSFISSYLTHTESVNYHMFTFKDTKIQIQTGNQTVQTIFPNSVMTTRMVYNQGSMLTTVVLWPQASKKRLGSSKKKTSTGPTGPVNILGHTYCQVSPQEFP